MGRTPSTASNMTGKQYQGFNWFLLAMAEDDGLAGRWATQAVAIRRRPGARVRRAPGSAPVILPDRRPSGGQGRRDVRAVQRLPLRRQSGDGYTRRRSPTGESNPVAEEWLGGRSRSPTSTTAVTRRSTHRVGHRPDPHREAVRDRGRVLRP